MSENLHKISGFTLFANSGGFRGGAKPPWRSANRGKIGGIFGGFRGVRRNPPGEKFGGFCQIWPIFGRFLAEFPAFLSSESTAEQPPGPPPKSPGFPEVHPPGPPGDPPGWKNGSFSGGKTSESTVEGPKFRGGFSGGHPGAPGGEFREISGNSGKFRPNCPQNPSHLPLFFPILNLRKHGRTAEMPGEISGGFRGEQLALILGRWRPGKTPCFPGKNPSKYRTKT